MAFPMLNSLWQWIRRHPGFIFLCLILGVISLGTLKPDFYLIGWDNFSSYLNPSSTFFKTLFSTWRDHRGLGVPSDAESTDIFRQLFNIVATSLFGMKLSDQLYLVAMLWGGVVSMYSLGRYISRHLQQSEKQQELFGTLAAFFYLFNLCTVGVFYFPMLMYNTRFFMLPSTCLALLIFLYEKKISIFQYVIFLFLLIFGIGAYMVPTVFVVSCMMFGLLFIVTDKKKRFLIFMAFYIGINSFWILPFANYTLQKASVVPYAPTFIELTESMMNKPASYYTFERQVKTRPSTFDAKFFRPGGELPFHPMAGYYESNTIRTILWIFPISYLLGIVFTFLYKRNRILIWLSLTLLLFLALSLKEYSPVGLIYGFISDRIPLMNMLFRYGDTKFHALIVFPGAVLSAFFFVTTITYLVRLRKLIITLLTGSLVVIVIVSHFWVYKSYFEGNLVGFMMYNVIPKAYFDISTIINDDPEPIRVVHLPMDGHVYWKPYSWGYYGSSFLHFMLNKPLFDRSFEPASMENADIHKQLMETIRLSSTVENEAMLDEQAQNTLKLLQSLSMKYIIDDQTVSINIDARDISYWGDINTVDTEKLLSYMEKKGYITLIRTYTVSSKEIFPLYSRLYPYHTKPSIDYQDKQIHLYQVDDAKPRILPISTVSKVHSYIQTIPTNLRRTVGNDFIQSPNYDEKSLLFPFTNQNNSITIDQNAVTIQAPTSLKPGNYTLSSNIENTSKLNRLVHVYTQNISTPTKKTLRVYIEDTLFPSLEGAIINYGAIRESVDLPIENDTYSHLAFGDSVLPLLPQVNSTEVKYLGSTIMRNDTITVSLLYPSNIYSISDNLKQFDSDPRCLHDEYENTSLEISTNNRTVDINGQNVSGCITLEEKVQTNDKVGYAELHYTLKGSSQPVYFEKELDSGKPVLNDVVSLMNNPLVIDVCVKNFESFLCLNKEQFSRISEKNTSYTTALKGVLSNLDTLLFTFTVRSNQRQKYHVSINDIVLNTFDHGVEQTIVFDAIEDRLSLIQVNKTTPLQFSAPITQSPFTQLINLASDGMLIGRDLACDDIGNIQNAKEEVDGILLYSVGCRSFLNKFAQFSTNNLYAWNIQYRHMSGAVPTFLIMDKYHTLFSQNLNPQDLPINSYFSIPLQKPESLFATHESTNNYIMSSLPHSLGGFISPRFELQNEKNKEILINRFTPNEGLAEIDRIALIELPNYWQNTILHSDDYADLTFSIPKATEFEQIIPSLWKVKVESEGEPFFTIFNEQYDNQWITLNTKKSEHARCNGYVNCYQIELNPGVSEYYLFYFPELLYFIGLGISVFAIIKGISVTKK